MWQGTNPLTLIADYVHIIFEMHLNTRAEQMLGNILTIFLERLVTNYFVYISDYCY